MKHTAQITANESVFLCDARRIVEKPMFKATIAVSGDFDGGTVTLQMSPDGGTTKINLRDVTGTIASITAADAYNIELGFGGTNGDNIKLYATMDGSSESTTGVNVAVFDNQ
jgi:hypothetical protein